MCADQPRAVELNYDYAFVRNSPSLVQSYRKNGSALAWAANRTINIPSQAFAFTGPVAVQLGTAVVPGSAYFTRGTNNWTYAGQIKAVDYGMGTGDSAKSSTGMASYSPTNAGICLTTALRRICMYKRLAGFDHVGILGSAGTFTIDFDISGKTIVSAGGSDRPPPGQVWCTSSLNPWSRPLRLPTTSMRVNVSGFTITPGTFGVCTGSRQFVQLRASAAG